MLVRLKPEPTRGDAGDMPVGSTFIIGEKLFIRVASRRYPAPTSRPWHINRPPPAPDRYVRVVNLSTGELRTIPRGVIVEPINAVATVED